MGLCKQVVFLLENRELLQRAANLQPHPRLAPFFAFASPLRLFHTWLRAMSRAGNSLSTSSQRVAMRHGVILQIGYFLSMRFFELVDRLFVLLFLNWNIDISF